MESLSIIIPLYNEEENVSLLYQNLQSVLADLQSNYEVILINDGSTDGTYSELEKLAKQDSHIKLINFRVNCGQTAAMSAGIDHSTGDIIIPMDGDNQNDPQDIPRLLDKIQEGYDVVSGWRKDRKDKAVTRILPSKIANAIISRIGGVRLHDYGCSLKAYKREVIKNVRLYGEMHRFIPIYASWQGAKVTEIVVNHHPRIFGTTKYGLNRTLKVALDLILIKYMENYMRNPIYLFGGFGIINLLLAMLSVMLMFYYKLWGGKTFIQTPLPQVFILFFLVGILSIFIGFMSEILMRTYYESQNKKSYLIKETMNMSKGNDRASLD